MRPLDCVWVILPCLAVGCAAITEEEEAIFDEMKVSMNVAKNVAVNKLTAELVEKKENLENHIVQLENQEKDLNVMVNALGETKVNLEDGNEELTKNNTYLNEINSQLDLRNIEFTKLRDERQGELKGLDLQIEAKNLNLKKLAEEENHMAGKKAHLDNQIGLLEKEINSKRLEKNNLEEQNKQFIESNTILGKNHSDLVVAVGVLEKTKENQEHDREELTKKNKELATDNTKLEKINSQLDSGNKEYCDEMLSGIKKQNEECEKAKKDYHEELLGIKKQNEEYKKAKDLSDSIIMALVIVLIALIVFVVFEVHQKTVLSSKTRIFRKKDDTAGFVSEDEDGEADGEKTQIAPTTSRNGGIRNRNPPVNITNIKVTKETKKTVRNTSPQTYIPQISQQFKIKIDLQETFHRIKQSNPEYIQFWVIEESQLIVTKLVMVKSKKGTKEAISVHLEQGSVTIPSNTADTLAGYGEQNYRGTKINDPNHQALIERAFERIPDVSLEEEHPESVQ